MVDFCVSVISSTSISWNSTLRAVKENSFLVTTITTATLLLITIVVPSIVL